MSAAEEPEEPKEAKESKDPCFDAGNKHLDHYAHRLPRWRNALRNHLIPVVRRETPWLALLQDKVRSPALDAYFAYTANLGTHTFYMIFLPIQFWCGYTSVGRATVFMLAAGVYSTGFLKDLLCLPRPLSPPLARITMSGSAALEYGFPSSHSANAVSVAFYAIYALRQSTSEYNPTVFTALQALFYFYAVSIIAGRLYCGMHGFLDVMIGSIMGAIITACQLRFGDWIDSWIFSGLYQDVVIATIVICILVRVHPEPADDCPCFDDSVSFSGVVIGINLGAWQYAQTRFAHNEAYPSTVPFNLQEIGLPKTALRIIVGVLVILIWRATMKPTLFKVLPPLFRLLEQARLNLPRAYFLDASKYTFIAPFTDDDNVIPPASELPRLVKNLAQPRKRAVSIGPQSAADAYETLAYRNRRRRLSVNSADGKQLEGATWLPSSISTSSIARSDPTLGGGLFPSPLASKIQSYEVQMGTGRVSLPEMDIDEPSKENKDQEMNGSNNSKTITTKPLQVAEDNEKRQIFMMLTKPRVRYDVEVVTKLIVYAGIGWIAVGGDPMLFEVLGLGMS